MIYIIYIIKYILYIIKYILITTTGMSSQQLSTINLTEFYKVSLAEVTYLLIRFSKSSSSHEPQKNTDRNAVNKQNTHKHTSHTEKDNTGKG